MRISGTAVAVSVILVCLLVKEPNKAKPTDKTSLIDDFRISLSSAVMASIMLTAMLQALFINAISPMLAIHLAELHGEAPAWSTGVIFALPSVAFVLTARTWTALGERWGYDRTIYIGLIGSGVGALSLTFTSNIWIFGLLFFISGLFLAAISPSAAALICTRVTETFRGRAYGMQLSAGTFGSLIAPIAASLVGEAYGIPATYVFVSVVFGLGMLGFRSLLRRWETA
jgi:DHA1 family multidrug resistance protein-like MFS transporter